MRNFFLGSSLWIVLGIQPIPFPFDDILSRFKLVNNNDSHRITSCLFSPLSANVAMGEIIVSDTDSETVFDITSILVHSTIYYNKIERTLSCFHYSLSHEFNIGQIQRIESVELNFVESAHQVKFLNLKTFLQSMKTKSSKSDSFTNLVGTLLKIHFGSLISDSSSVAVIRNNQSQPENELFVIIGGQPLRMNFDDSVKFTSFDGSRTIQTGLHATRDEYFAYLADLPDLTGNPNSKINFHNLLDLTQFTRIKIGPEILNSDIHGGRDHFFDEYMLNWTPQFVLSDLWTFVFKNSKFMAKSVSSVIISELNSKIADCLKSSHSIRLVETKINIRNSKSPGEFFSVELDVINSSSLTLKDPTYNIIISLVDLKDNSYDTGVRLIMVQKALNTAGSTIIPSSSNKKIIDLVINLDEGNKKLGIGYDENCYQTAFKRHNISGFWLKRAFSDLSKHDFKGKIQKDLTGLLNLYRSPTLGKKFCFQDARIMLIQLNSVVKTLTKNKSDTKSRLLVQELEENLPQQIHKILHLPNSIKSMRYLTFKQVIKPFFLNNKERALGAYLIAQIKDLEATCQIILPDGSDAILNHADEVIISQNQLEDRLKSSLHSLGRKLFAEINDFYDGRKNMIKTLREIQLPKTKTSIDTLGYIIKDEFIFLINEPRNKNRMISLHQDLLELVQIPDVPTIIDVDYRTWVDRGANFAIQESCRLNNRVMDDAENGYGVINNHVDFRSTGALNVLTVNEQNIRFKEYLYKFQELNEDINIITKNLDSCDQERAITEEIVNRGIQSATSEELKSVAIVIKLLLSTEAALDAASMALDSFKKFFPIEYAAATTAYNKYVLETSVAAMVSFKKAEIALSKLHSRDTIKNFDPAVNMIMKLHAVLTVPEEEATAIYEESHATLSIGNMASKKVSQSLLVNDDRIQQLTPFALENLQNVLSSSGLLLKISLPSEQIEKAKSKIISLQKSQYIGAVVGEYLGIGAAKNGFLDEVEEKNISEIVNKIDLLVVRLQTVETGFDAIKNIYQIVKNEIAARESGKKMNLLFDLYNTLDDAEKAMVFLRGIAKNSRLVIEKCSSVAIYKDDGRLHDQCSKQVLLSYFENQRKFFDESVSKSLPLLDQIKQLTTKMDEIPIDSSNQSNGQNEVRQLTASESRKNIIDAKVFIFAEEISSLRNSIDEFIENPIMKLEYQFKTSPPLPEIVIKVKDDEDDDDDDEENTDESEEDEVEKEAKRKKEEERKREEKQRNEERQRKRAEKEAKEKAEEEKRKAEEDRKRKEAEEQEKKLSDDAYNTAKIAEIVIIVIFSTFFTVAVILFIVTKRKQVSSTQSLFNDRELDELDKGSVSFARRSQQSNNSVHKVFQLTVGGSSHSSASELIVDSDKESNKITTKKDVQPKSILKKKKTNDDVLSIENIGF